MHAPRAKTPSPRRFVAGLAAAAVTTAGLACMGTAHAADPAGFPRTLDFRVNDQVATGDDVFAVGYVGTGTGEETEFEFVDGYVEAVGAQEQVHLGDGSWPTAVAVSPDGETLHVIGELTDEEDPDRPRRNVSWTLDTDTMTLSEPTTFDGLNPYAIAAGAEDTYVAWTNGEGIGGVTMGGQHVELGPNVQPSHLVAVSDDVAPGVVLVGAADYSEGWGSGLPTVRAVTPDGVSDRIVLGPDDTENRGFIVDMDVDEVNELTYVLTARDVDGPQEYGLNVLGAGIDRFIELDGWASAIAVSGDGETVYVSSNGVAAYDADALESYTEDNPAPTTYLGGAGLLALAPSGRLYVAQDEETGEDPETSRTVTRMHALEAPSSPTNLRAVGADWSAGALLVSWEAAASAGGADDDSLSYRVTLTDTAGGDPVVQEPWMPEADFYDLEEGHTYTVSVVTTNGAFSSSPATTTYQVLPAVKHPSAIAVRGKLAVGQRLSVANTGSWAPGTTLTYVWGTQNNEDIAHGPTMTLSRAHLGRNIWVRVTGTKAGSAPATVYSDLTRKVVPGTLTAPVPSIGGVAKVGKKLTAKPGRWTSGTMLTYRWLANGKAIKGAAARTLKLKRAQAGKKITVVVTGTKPGYRTAKKTSVATTKVKR